MVISLFNRSVSLMASCHCSNDTLGGSARLLVADKIVDPGDGKILSAKLKTEGGCVVFACMVVGSASLVDVSCCNQHTR
jgi:hypothetical protein